MKKNLLQSVIVLAATAGLLALAGCDTEVKDEKLSVPLNVSVSVVGRWFTVSWDAVKNADGYVVYTESVGCGSGNRTAYTVDQTATNHAETPQPVTSVFPANGSVEFPTATSIRIWLMPKEMQMDNSKNVEPMASQVSAKVKAVKTSDPSLDSDYSEVKIVVKADYEPGN